MENTFQPSFVPKRQIIPTQGNLRPRTRTSLFMLVAVILFLLSVATTAGLFAYNAFVTASNTTKQQKIQDAIKEFKSSESDLTGQLSLLKARIDAARQLLQSHAAVSEFLALLESNTAQSVRYTDFGYTNAGGNKVSVDMKGESSSYAAVAFQSDVLSRNENLSSVIFSDINLSDSGLINFSVKANVDPKLLSYQAVVSAAAAAQAQSQMPTDTTPPDSSTPSASATSTATSTQP